MNPLGAGGFMNRPRRCFGQESFPILVELLIAGEGAKAISFPFIVAEETGGFSLDFVYRLPAHRVLGCGRLKARFVAGHIAGNLGGPARFRRVTPRILFKMLFASL